MKTYMSVVGTDYNTLNFKHYIKEVITHVRTDILTSNQCLSVINPPIGFCLN